MVNRITTPKARIDTGFFNIEVFKDATYESMIATLETGVYVKGGDLQPGNITDIYVQPQYFDVQVITQYNVIFTIENQLYKESSIEIEFPTTIILPNSPSQVVVIFSGESASYITATTGTVMQGNIIKIDELFGDSDPPEKEITFNIIIEGLQNPYSSQPAGGVCIRTYWLIFGIDSGCIEETFTPISGLIDSQGITVVPPVTSGTNSQYILVMVPDSAVPKNGFVIINVPPELIFIDDQWRSGGSCTGSDKTISCETMINNQLTIKTLEEIPAKVAYTIILTGIRNPRSEAQTGNFEIITFDINGSAEIDKGFGDSTSMKELSEISNFAVVSFNQTNGAVATYQFTITTTIKVIDGDRFQFTVPD